MYNLRILFHLFCLIGFTLYSNITYSQIKYVKPISTGTGDGSSWANASSNLQAMIQASPSGGQVWVKSGTYFPTTKPYNGLSPISTSDSRDVTFHIKDNVSLFGGFNGTETSINQRNISLNETILSGDIGIIGDSTDNAYHVVMLVRTGLATQDGVLDGFTIKNGNANGTGSVSTILYPSLRDFGGGVYTSGALGTIKNCKINSCGGTNGGAVYSAESNLNFDYCNVFENHSNSKGGGIHVSDYPGSNILNVKHSNFYNNQSLNKGGAIYMKYGTLTIDSCTFYGNISSSVGSGVCGEYLNLSIKECEFYQNQTSSGGALYLFQGVGTIHFNSFYNNQGGGVSLSNNISGNILLENNDFHNNSSNYGAALAFNSGKTTIKRNIFYDNSAISSGGAIHFLASASPNSPTMNYSIVEQNIFLNNQTTIANLSSGAGGAWYSQGGVHKIRNNLFISNTANLGGAVSNESSIINFENNTFYSNSSNSNGGAILSENSIDTLTNNIFRENLKWSNTTSSDIEQTSSFPNIALFNNDLQASSITSYWFASANFGNLFQLNPLFINETDFDGLDNLYFTEDDGLSLQKCSPLIDKGLVVPNINTDIIGNPRVQSLNIDLGAYETAFENTIPNPVTLFGGGGYCIGDTGLIIGIVNAEPGVVYNLLFNGNETGDSIVLTGASDFGNQTNEGIYSVVAETIISSCTLEIDTTISIIILDLPSVEINIDPAIICEGQNVIFNPSGAINYQWSDSSINSGVPFTPINGATYILTGIDGNGCSNIDSLIINTLPLPDNSLSVNGVTITASLIGGTYQWLDCNLGQPILAETNQVFTATSNGSYSVIVTDGQCSDTSDCIMISNIGLEENKAKEIHVYPNPSKGLFNIELHYNSTLYISDEFGRILSSIQFEAGKTTIDLSNESNGVYFIKINSDSFTETIRIIKN